MAKTKLWVLKKTDSISPKTQNFLYTKFSSIEDHNQTKQSFHTRILRKKRYSKPPNKYPYKILTISIQNSIHKLMPKFLTYPYKSSKHSIPLLFFSPSFFLLLFSSSSSSSPSLLFPHRICPIPKAKNEIFCLSLIRPCLALYKFVLFFGFLLLGPLFCYYLKINLFIFPLKHIIFLSYDLWVFDW